MDQDNVGFKDWLIPVKEVSVIKNVSLLQTHGVVKLT